MPARLILPNFSATMETAKIGKWLRKSGDLVVAGDAVVEVETDKTMLEIEACASGVLGDILVGEGDTAAVGDVLVYIYQDGEDQCSNVPDSDSSDSAPSESTETSDAGQEGQEANLVQVGAVRASPAARRLARELEVDLTKLTGSGPRGRIGKEDVVSAARKKTLVADVNCPASAANSAEESIRRRIAAQVCESRRSIPSFCLERWVDIGSMDIGERKVLGSDVRVTITDFFVHSLNEIIDNHPMISHVWDQAAEKARRLDNPGIGLIVGLNSGMVIPVLPNLKGKSVEAVSILRHEAVSTARSNRLGNKFIGEAAITISNLSRGGADRFEAIINPGECAILAIGRVHERVVARDGMIAISRGCFVTLSVDHRVIDGLVGAAFLGDLVEHLEGSVG